MMANKTASYKKNSYSRWTSFLFLLYCLILVKLLFLKITLNFSDISISGNERNSFSYLLSVSNFIPFAKIWYYASGNEPYLVGLLNVGGNIILFIPMGIFLPLLFEGIRTAKRVLMVSTVMCLCIEVLQLLTTTGEADIDDVILNVAGTLIGYAFFKRWRSVVGLRNNN